ncbi:hypothetical protein [Prosthecomicrobium sp. N25]|uniref:hypothetical protein n=1 Tax=Prosthecomicrobium sp. N25 TaxID=3129254 RepID=UPI003076B50F
MRTIVAMAAVVLSLWASGRAILPAALEARAWWAAADDPVALARRELAEAATPERLSEGARAALAAGDLDLARSFSALAAQTGVRLDPAVASALAASEANESWDSAKAFARGAVVGDGEGLAGLAGAFAADLVGIGDLRDLGREGWRAARGEAVDEIVVGLSAAGLAVTGATWALAGSPAPVRAGLTLVKGARKAGRLSAPLAASLGRSLGEAVDGAALRRVLAAAGSLDVAAARRAAAEAVRADRLGPLVTLGEDTAWLYRRAGAGAVQDALVLVRSADEMGRVARLGEAFGAGTRAVLKLVGRRALVLARSLAVLAGWMLAAIGWAWSAAAAAAAFGRWLARATPPRPRRVRAGRDIRLEAVAGPA